MHRPTRKHSALKEKLEAKAGRSRNNGKKAKRWKKWIAQYEAACEGSSSDDAS